MWELKKKNGKESQKKTEVEKDRSLKGYIKEEVLIQNGKMYDTQP